MPGVEVRGSVAIQRVELIVVDASAEWKRPNAGDVRQCFPIGVGEPELQSVAEALLDVSLETVVVRNSAPLRLV